MTVEPEREKRTVRSEENKKHILRELPLLFLG